MINPKITVGMLELEIIKRYFEFNYFKKNPNYHFEGTAYTKERCSNLADVEDTITDCLRMMHYAPQTRKDITEQILMELKII